MNWNSLRSAWKLAAAAVVVTGAFCGQARAVNNVNSFWLFEGATTTNTAGQTPPNQPFSPEIGFSGEATGFHSDATTVWSTPAGNGSTKSLSSNTWNVGDYYQFRADNSSGNSNFGLQFDQISSTSGPKNFQISYSTNGTTWIDLPGGAYSVQPNANPSWSGNGVVAPTGLDTYLFDLRSITALNTATDIYVRMTAASPLVAAQLGQTFNNVGANSGTNRIDNVGIFYNFNPSVATTSEPSIMIKQPFAAPVLPITGDVVIGLGSGRTSTTLELVRGTVTPGGATRPAPLSPWTTQNFTRFVKFDNLGGAAHNVHGNLLAVDPGSSATSGGNIYSYATQGTQPLPAPQLLATTNTGSGAATRLGGLSVSPDNTKIALAGFDTGKVLVYDYTAGNGLGTGTPSLNGLRQSAAILGTGANYSAGSQQGTAWKDNNTVLAFAGDGKLYTVDATTMANTQVANVGIATGLQSSTALAYNPTVSPLIYATYSTFSGASGTPPNTTTNKLYIFDPAASYADLTGGGLDFSTSAPNTIRDIALDASGNLVFVTNAPTSSTGNARLEYVTAADLAAKNPNSSVDWFNDDIFQTQPGFTGLDIGFAPPAGITGDYNNDGKVDAGDYVTWRKAQGTTNALANDPVGGTIGTAQYNNWRANFGKPPGAGSGLDGASVPEPASMGLLLIGLAAFGWRRREG